MSRTIGKETFITTLKKVSANASAVGEEILKRDVSSFDNDKKTYTDNIKKEAVSYKQSVLAVKELDGIRKLIPGGKSALIDMAASQATATIERVSGYKTMLEQLTDKLKSSEDNKKDLEVARKSVGDEYDNVLKLLKKKFITGIRYESGVGLLWTYPPMVYVAEGKTYFLGKPEAGLSEINSNGFSLKLPSYKTDGHIGTYHMRHQDNGSSYCLGGYDDILHILAAKMQLSSLIRMFKEYFQSCNPKSKHNSPIYETMAISSPKVIDDSFVEFVKSNPNFKFPPPPKILEPEPEDAPCAECGGDGCGECQED